MQWHAPARNGACGMQLRRVRGLEVGFGVLQLLGAWEVLHCHYLQVFACRSSAWRPLIGTMWRGWLLLPAHCQVSAQAPGDD